MQITGPVPILYVSRMDETVRFYTEVLGFECASRTDGWASLECGAAEIMISLPNEHLPFEKAGFTGSFYFRTEEVDAIWEKLQHQVTVVYPIEDFDYGMREFAIRDNSGYLLQFGQEMESQ